MRSDQIASTNGRPRSPGDGFEHATQARGRGELANVAIPLGVRAPGVARSVVARCLAEYVAPSMLETLLLLVSELVTNSVRHSGAAEGEDIVVRVHVWRGMCRLEVEDPGHEGAIAPRPPHLGSGAGMGLNLLATLSECWGVERAARGPTRVWAQLPSGVRA
jgi:anti-sigma regulatory factor (Ser/Thr protein kinase)